VNHRSTAPNGLVTGPKIGPKSRPSWIDAPAGSLVALARPQPAAVAAGADCRPVAKLIMVVLILGQISAAGGRISGLQDVGSLSFGAALLWPLVLGFAVLAFSRLSQICASLLRGSPQRVSTRMTLTAQGLLATVMFAVTLRLALNGVPLSDATGRVPLTIPPESALPAVAGGNLQEVIVSIVFTIIAVIVLAVLVTMAVVEYNRRKLRAAFGPEYDRVAQQLGTRRGAYQELLRRKHEHGKLELRPVTVQDQEFYTTSWHHLQGEFLDDPALSLTDAEKLITGLIDFRGYPGEDPDEQLALLSVEHAGSLADYRSAQQISRHAHEDTASTSTEDMRQALLSYHVLFSDLLSDPSASSSASDSDV